MKKTQSSYEWVREVQPDIKALDSIPLTGHAASFPWEELTARLARTFERQDLSITPAEISWKSEQELYDGIGTNCLPLSFSLAPIQGEVHFLMPIHEIGQLAALLLTKDSHPGMNMLEPSFVESFYRFFALETLYHFHEVFADKTINPILANQGTHPNQHSLCQDIRLESAGQTLWGRLVISPQFRQSWVEHFALNPEPTELSKELSESIEIDVHLEAGSTSLTLAEWNTVRLGDFMILDNCLLDPETFEGPITMTAHKRPLFKSELKNNKIKILERPPF